MNYIECAFFEWFMSLAFSSGTLLAKITVEFGRNVTVIGSLAAEEA